MNGLKLTPLARQDLLEIGDYIAKDNQVAALNLVQRIHARCSDLIDHPKLGRKRDELYAKLRSVSEGDYLIFYRIQHKEIEVLRVIHGKRDLRHVRFTD